MLGGIQLGLLVEVPLCEIGGMQFGVLVTAGCWTACSLGPGARGHVVWGAGGGAALRDWRPGAEGMQFGVLVDAVLRA